MELKAQIERDLKSAMLAGDKTLAMILRGIKSALLNAEIAAGKREQGLEDSEITQVLRKEAKRRHESAELYARGGNQEKADAEKHELQVIEKYLPEQLSDNQLDDFVDQAFSEIGEVSPQSMGKVIGRVKELSQGQADGGRIVGAVRKRMEQK